MPNMSSAMFQTNLRLDVGVQTFHQQIDCFKDYLFATGPCVAEVVLG